MTTLAFKDRLCLALDLDSPEQAADFSERLSPWIGLFKIGSQLFTRAGPQVVDAVRRRGGRVFLDLKYHDIPHTVAQAARLTVRMGVSLLTVHCLGGFRMMTAVAEAVHDEAARAGVKPPRIVGVTALTSHTPEEWRRDLCSDLPLESHVRHLATQAKRAGLDGVVCSPHEIALVQEACGADFILVTPGIRPSWSLSTDDQRRTMTPATAMASGATYLVIGRPILESNDPEQAAQRLLTEIRDAELPKHPRFLRGSGARHD